MVTKALPFKELIYCSCSVIVWSKIVLKKLRLLSIAMNDVLMIGAGSSFDSSEELFRYSSVLSVVLVNLLVISAMTISATRIKYNKSVWMRC